MTLALHSLFTTTAQAKVNVVSEGGPFGLGIVLGDPSAITARYDFSSEKAIDGGLSFFSNDWVLVYVDGLYKFNDGFGHSHSFFAQTTPYIGAGAVIVSSSKSRHDRYFSGSDSANFALGIRVPLGAEWKPTRVPVGVFAEVSPGLVIIPGTYGFLQAGIGARYYF